MPPKKKKRSELQTVILSSSFDTNVKDNLINKVETLELMSTENAEYFKLKQWIDTVIKIISTKHCYLPISKLDPIDEIYSFMKKTRRILDDTVYGLVDTKQQLMRIIAQWITNPFIKD